MKPSIKEISDMTLRDYFAAKTMQGICAGDWKFDLQNGAYSWVDIASKKAYEISDAMLKARNESTKIEIKPVKPIKLTKKTK